jgi:hypothetical protein
MPTVRVFLCTYRRPHLLRRALSSLLAQTHRDWICELHNDAPDDDTPRTLLRELAPDDPRFSYHPHPRNWGAVATFNHAFAGGAEPYAALLEDDNWWDAAFLHTAVAALEPRPDASLVWANMRLWQERPDGTWQDLDRTIWNCAPASPGVLEFRSPELLQAFDAVHSNGAMVYRPRAFRVTTVPLQLPFAIIEVARERAATGPLLFLTMPLAHFALTLTTARGADPARWLQAKLLIAASFFTHISCSADSLARLWALRRTQKPRDTGIFFCLTLALRDTRFIRAARPRDWLHFLLSSVRHPLCLIRGLRFRRDQPEAWAWLLAQTRASPTAAARTTLLTKQIPP